MDQISISTIFKKRHLVCRAITNDDYSKLREEQFPKRVKCSRSFNFGAKQDLSPDILQDYQYAGAIHILSVSGLRWIPVAVFDFFLNPFPTQKALS
jgi:competence protein ComEC